MAKLEGCKLRLWANLRYSCPSKPGGTLVRKIASLVVGVEDSGDLRDVFRELVLGLPGHHQWMGEIHSEIVGESTKEEFRVRGVKFPGEIEAVPLPEPKGTRYPVQGEPENPPAAWEAGAVYGVRCLEVRENYSEPHGGLENVLDTYSREGNFRTCDCGRCMYRSLPPLRA